MGVFRYIFATPQRNDDGLNMRAWFAIYVVYMAAICALSNWGLARYNDTGEIWAKAVWFLGLYMFYYSLACTYIPLPTLWFVLLLASPAGGLTALTPLWRILSVAGLGALATAVSHTNEYHVFAYLLRLGRVHLIKQSRIYLWAERQFKTWPFGLLVVFTFLPVPADPVRWLAIMSGYPLPRYFAAQWLGRFIRYAMLAYVAQSLQLTLVQIIMISVLIVLISFTVVGIQKLREGRERVDPQPAQD